MIGKSLNQELIEQLVELRTLLSDPARWTQREYAKDKFGNSVDPLGSTATCWCLAGAMRKVINGDNRYIIRSLIQNQANARLGVPVGYISFNDNATHNDVIALLNATIEKVQQED